MLTRWYSTPRSSLWDSPMFGPSLFDDVVQNMFQAARSVPSSAPRLVHYTDGSDTIIAAEVPGMSDGDLSIAVDNGTVTVSGQRAFDVPDGYKVLARERAPMQFARSFRLSNDMDVDGIEAKLDNGMLTVRIPKKPEAEPRRIPVAVS